MKNKTWIYISLIILITVVVFFPALEGEYLNWDDNQQITENQDVLNLSWESFKNYFTSYYVASYQPLASLSYGLEYYLFGNNPLVPHVTNLIVHLLNTILVFFLVVRLLPKQRILNYFIVAIFAIHPLQAELIGWISTRSTLLFSTFFLVSCLHYLKFISGEKNSRKYYWLALLFFVLALLSKAASVVLPLVLLLLDYVYRRRVSLKLFIEKIPFFIGSIVIGIVSLLSRKVSQSIGDFDTYYTFYEKLSISSFSLFQYLKKSFIPSDLEFFYGYPYKVIEGESIDFTFLIAPLWVILIIAFCWLIYKKSPKENKRLWIFGVLFFVANIILVINVTPFTSTFFSERYMYLAIIGVFIAVNIVLNGFISKNPIVKNGVYIGLSIFLVTLAAKSRERSSLWVSDFSLWSYVESYKGQAATPYRKLGQIYANRKNHIKAIEIYNNGISRNPYSIELYYWRSKSIMETGDLEYAKKDLNRVISSNDKLKGEAFYEKALIFRRQNLLDSARVSMDSARVYNLEKALFDEGNSPNSFNQLKVAETNILKIIDSLIKTENYIGAIERYESLLLLVPGTTKYMLEKGKLETQTRQWEKAITTFDQILEIDSKDKIARLSRAFIFSNTNKMEEAIKDYSFAIDNFDDTTGEIYYFRAMTYFRNKQNNLGCADISKAAALGYSIPNEITTKICK